MVVERTELSPEARAILTEPEAFQRASQNSPIRLAHRNASALAISNMDFVGIELENVHFSNVEFKDVRFTGAPEGSIV